jgi:hypothetical protein
MGLDGSQRREYDRRLIHQVVREKPCSPGFTPVYGEATMWQRLGRFLQRQVLDRFYYTRNWVMNVIVWLAIRLTAYEITFTCVVEKKKATNQVFADLNLDRATDLDGLSKYADGELKEATVRRGVVTDKCKTLFTFNTALLALIAIFQGKVAELTSWEACLFYIAVIFFVVAMLVLWAYFDVGEETSMQLDQTEVSLSKVDLQKSVINSNRKCADDTDNRTDFLVDLYKTSRFYLMAGFVLLFVVFSHGHFARSSLTDAGKIDNKLQNDAKFQEKIPEAKD